MNNNITIANSTVTINNINEEIERAKDQLLTKLFFARNKKSVGGFDAWLELLNMYYAFEYDEMIEKIKSFSGPGGATRSACINLINVIKGGN